MSPIATYTYSRWHWKVVVSLFPEEIVTETTHLIRGATKTSQPLGALLPKPDSGSTRPFGFAEAVTLLLVSSALGAFWLVTQGFPPEEYGPLACGVFAMIGLGGAIWNFRRWNYVTFKSDQGIPLLIVWSSKQTQMSFEPFVSAVIRQIETVRGKPTE